MILSGMNRGELTNAQWERLQPLLPPQKSKTGRPAVDHRRILNGRLWMLRTGAPWRDLPERDGPGRPVARRFYRWQQAGLWQAGFAAVKQHAEASGQLKGDLHDVDSTMIRAHQHAAGAKKGPQSPTRADAARAGSAPRCTCARTGMASGAPWC